MAQEGVDRAITDAINSGLCTKPADIMLFLRSTLMATRMPSEVHRPSSCMSGACWLLHYPLDCQCRPADIGLRVASDVDCKTLSSDGRAEASICLSLMSLSGLPVQSACHRRLNCIWALAAIVHLLQLALLKEAYTAVIGAAGITCCSCSLLPLFRL